MLASAYIEYTRIDGTIFFLYFEIFVLYANVLFQNAKFVIKLNGSVV